MSWLSDHLFGTTKAREAPADGIAAPTDDAAAVGSADPVAVSGPSEIQNDTVTTSNAVANDDSNAYENREVTAEWQVPVRGKLHKIEFEHGTTSGRRILWIDEKV